MCQNIIFAHTTAPSCPTSMLYTHTKTRFRAHGRPQNPLALRADNLLPTPFLAAHNHSRRGLLGDAISTRRVGNYSRYVLVAVTYCRCNQQGSGHRTHQATPHPPPIIRQWVAHETGILVAIKAVLPFFLPSFLPSTWGHFRPSWQKNVRKKEQNDNGERYVRNLKLLRTVFFLLPFLTTRVRYQTLTTAVGT